MTDAAKPSIENLRQKLAQAGTDAERLAALLAFRVVASELPVREADSRFREAVVLARKTGSHDDLARAGIALSEFHRNLGDISGSLECAGYVDEAARATGSKKHEGSHLYLRGRAYQEHGNYVKAHDFFERALAAWRQAGHSRGIGAALNQLGSLLGLQGKAAEALEYYQECLKIDDELGDVAGSAMHQYNVGEALGRLGRWEDAVESYYRVIALSERQRLPALRACALNALGELYLDRDKPAKAISTFNLVIEAAEHGEALPGTLHESLANLGLAYHRQGEPASAGQAYERALQAAEKAGDRRVVAIVLCGMAGLALEQGRPGCGSGFPSATGSRTGVLSHTAGRGQESSPTPHADSHDRCEELVARAGAIARELGLRCEQAQALRLQAQLHAARGEDAKALDCFERAMALLRDLEESCDLARVRYHYGRYLLSQGKQEPALSHLKAASRVLRKLSIVADANAVNRLLFRQEMDRDPDQALLQAVSELASLSLSPQTLLEQVGALLKDALRCDGVALVVQGRTVLNVGNPVPETVTASDPGVQPTSSDTCLRWPIHYGASLLGHLYLARTRSDPTAPNQLVLDTVAKLLAGPVHRLAELCAGALEERPGLVGLRYHGAIGPNSRMREVLAQVCEVADKDTPVMITGERGTGKELAARALHESSRRAGRPFVMANCAALPDDVLALELFGTEDSSRPGQAPAKGKFETADQGTLFLDQVGKVGLELQAKLARVLKEGWFCRAGGSSPVAVKARIVAAASRSPTAMASQKKLDPELYRLLGTCELALPRLRDRLDDLPELARHFIRQSNQEFRRDVIDLSPEALARFMAYDWPGNIRELEQVVERSVLLARTDTITLDDLPLSLQPESQVVTQARTRMDR